MTTRRAPDTGDHVLVRGTVVSDVDGVSLIRLHQSWPTEFVVGVLGGGLEVDDRDRAGEADASPETGAPSAPPEVYVPIGTLPKGWTVDGALVLGRATDDRGQPRVFGRTVGRVMLWEELGMLENERQAVLRQLAELPRDDEERPGSFWADGRWWPYAVGSETQEP